ncbi:hypothetical protein SAMN02927937_02068 [Paenimyroides aquimaris]|uniref:DUF4251 domain-containing protein n=1 Tax=Paenimyroides marinum TaxID=1159016 RepID=A0A1H6LWL8_9FLAO|nr:hypothetical protein [Paenimyroides aquimaris]SEH90829.1 hypothetical protein SAMN02927937_02068 [Paenimyroides aquimaris]
MKKAVLLLLFFGIVACTSESLSVKQATALINDHTEKYPYFEKATLQLGEQKFRVKKDSVELSVLKNLASQGFITFNTLNARKKLLSKDSVQVVTIALTANASKYVVNQKKNKAEIKTFLFTIQENSDVQLELNNKTKATATAKLIKQPTPFAGLVKDKNANSEFITQKFVLKYKKETGWYVQK